MNQITKVNNGWKLKLKPRPDAFTSSGETDGHNQWRNQDSAAKTPNLPSEIPAEVPGSIHLDLLNANLIADISVNGREQDQMWIWRTDSSYTTSLPKAAAGKKYFLKFHGLDTLATVRINGEVKLQTKNMHRSYLLDITEQIIAGDVSLSIDFEAPLSNAETQVAKLGLYPRPYNMPYNYQRKMACSYGWDWGPITISSGIWKPVELFAFEKSAISSFSAITDVHDGKGALKIKVELLGALTGAKLKVLLKDGNSILAEQNLNGLVGEFSDLDIKLWQPRGRGEQKLYQVEVQLIDGNQVIQSQSKSVGFRKVELDTSAVSEDKHMFAIKVNGLRLWIRGANWIPDDPFPTRISRARYEKRISDMLEVNINGIRVWGGGIYESEDFYELCDQEGIVVWQDFLFACAAYPETPEMFEEVDAEVAEAAGRLGSHPSLVIWCGGNECIEGFQYWGWQPDLAGKPWGETFYLKTIPDQLHKWDTTRPYIPGSPFSTHSDDVRSFDSGTNHIWDVWNELGYERYEQYQPAFAAEFGFNGPGSWTMLADAIGKNNLDSRDPELGDHQKAFDGMDKVAAGLKREFANPPVEGPAWYFAAALDQARAVEVGLKHFRSLYETCSGSILWQFNDMWPAISWAVTDYTGFRKLAWHAMKSAYKPRTFSIGRVDQGAQLTIINDTQEPWNTEIKTTLIDADGKIVGSENIKVELEPFEVQRKKLTEVFSVIEDGNYEGFLHAQGDGITAARRSTLQPAKAAPKQELVATYAEASGNLTIKVSAKSYLHELCVLPELYGLGVNSDNQLVSLLPGQEANFVITGPREVLSKVKENLDMALWSHNRLVNQ
jgi:beta-mannosidase